MRTTREQMERVQVTGTDFVTLSGGSGSLTVTLVNGLEQPITVGTARPRGQLTGQGGDTGARSTCSRGNAPRSGSR